VTRVLVYRISQIILVFLMVVVFGCAALPTKPIAPEVAHVKKESFPAFTERYRSKAMEYEKNGELRKALQSYEIVSKFSPKDKDVAKKITDIKEQVNLLANQHFKQGLSYYENNSIQAARKEFLITLSLNPEHKEAMEYVKYKLSGEDYTPYEAKKDDTLKEIAKRLYNDPQKDFIIAYFNDLGKDTKLASDTTLKIPIVEPVRTKQPIEPKETPVEIKEIPFDMEEMLNKASASIKSKNYQDAISITEKILAYEPTNKNARDINNESYYLIGKTLSRGKKYKEALAMFNHVDPKYKDIKESIAFVKKQLANVHYIKGVKYFTDEELDKAIKEWEETLALDPNHPKAKKDIENARSLLQRLKEIK